TLFDLVDPEDARRDRFGGGERRAEVLLRRTDEAGEDPADVEPQQRQTPGCRHRLRGERLSTTGNARDEHALRRREPELLGFSEPGSVSAGEPAFEVVEATDRVEVEGFRHK